MILCTMGGYSSATQTDICRYLKLLSLRLNCSSISLKMDICAMLGTTVDKLQSILAEKGLRIQQNLSIVIVVVLQAVVAEESAEVGLGCTWKNYGKMEQFILQQALMEQVFIEQVLHQRHLMELQQLTQIGIILHLTDDEQFELDKAEVVKVMKVYNDGHGVAHEEKGTEMDRNKKRLRVLEILIEGKGKEMDRNGGKCEALFSPKLSSQFWAD
ncbi:hypothetical protein Tco_0689219 [Tanacetum coccineum]